jgi:hypothetical protein
VFEANLRYVIPVEMKGCTKTSFDGGEWFTVVGLEKERVAVPPMPRLIPIHYWLKAYTSSLRPHRLVG